MALTINRKDEITVDEFTFIKNKFGQNTNSGAIYSSIKYLVHQAPQMEEEIKRLKQELRESSRNYNDLIKTIKKKHQSETKIGKLVSVNTQDN